MKTSRRIKDEEHEDLGIIVKDIDEANKRMESIQGQIHMAEMLGIGTSEYEKRASRPVHLGKGSTKDWIDGKKITVHTIQQWKTEEGNTAFALDCHVWKKKEESDEG
jgi:hypothetical protein